MKRMKPNQFQSIRKARKALAAIAFGLAAAVFAGGSSTAVRAETEAHLIAAAKKKVFPALVRIDVRKDAFLRGEKTRSGGQGSGVIFTQDGYIITNYHVAGKAKKVECILYNKEKISARLVGDDPWTDLAVLQLDMDEIRKKGFDLKWAELGDSSTLQIGETVMAMGTPFGLARTLTLGVVSNNERVFGEEELTLDKGVATGMFNTWLQTDAAINPGNSGGPLVNLKGEVVGVNTRAVVMANNLGFTIPINVAREVVNEILKHGSVKRSTIGVQLQNLQDLEGFFQTDLNQGVLIRSVEPNSPAEGAGIQPEDILLAIDGQSVSARFPEELPAIRKQIADYPIGETLKLDIQRRGQKLTFEVVSQELGEQMGEDLEFNEWGFTAVGITELMARRNKHEDSEGILATGIRPGGPAESGGLLGGDVIRFVDGVKIKGLEHFQEIYGEYIETGREEALLEVIRTGIAVNLALIKYQKEDAEKENGEAEGAQE